jgi:hypothetical protein
MFSSRFPAAAGYCKLRLPVLPVVLWVLLVGSTRHRGLRGTLASRSPSPVPAVLVLVCKSFASGSMVWHCVRDNVRFASVLGSFFFYWTTFAVYVKLLFIRRQSVSGFRRKTVLVYHFWVLGSAVVRAVVRLYKTWLKPSAFCMHVEHTGVAEKKNSLPVKIPNHQQTCQAVRCSFTGKNRSYQNLVLNVYDDMDVLRLHFNDRRFQFNVLAYWLTFVHALVLQKHRRLYQLQAPQTGMKRQVCRQPASGSSLRF